MNIIEHVFHVPCAYTYSMDWTDEDDKSSDIANILTTYIKWKKKDKQTETQPD